MPFPIENIRQAVVAITSLHVCSLKLKMEWMSSERVDLRQRCAKGDEI